MAFDRARVGIRTPNLLIRSQVLYPIELRMRFVRCEKEYLFPQTECKGKSKIGICLNLSNKLMEKIMQHAQFSP